MDTSESLPHGGPRRPLNILMASVGSSGDLEPFLWLGARLRERGHRVTLAAPSYYAGFAARTGLEVLSFPVSPGTGGGAPIVRGHGRAAAAARRSAVASAAAKLAKRLESRSGPPPDLVIAHRMALGAAVYADSRDVPFVACVVSPHYLRTVGDQAGKPGFATGIAFYLETLMARLSKGTRRRIRAELEDPVNRLRRKCGQAVPRRDISAGFMLRPQAVCTLFPRWFFGKGIRLPPGLMFGPFPLETNPSISWIGPEVAAFFREGQPPVLVTAGSFEHGQGPFLENVADALATAGHRVLVVAPDSSTVRALPKGVFKTRFLPFANVLPQCAAILHQGGAGTAAHALQAGVPQVIAPWIWDQWHTSRHLARLGVAATIDPRKASGAEAAGALARVLADPRIHARCREVSERVRSALDAGPLLDWLEVRARPAGNSSPATKTRTFFDLHAGEPETVRNRNFAALRRELEEGRTIGFISSFPRSGNTWMRLLIGHCLRFRMGADAPLNPAETLIPDIYKTPVESPLPWFLPMRLVKSHESWDICAESLGRPEPSRVRHLCVFRKAEDSLVSFYHFNRMRPEAERPADIDRFAAKHLGRWVSHMQSFLEGSRTGPVRFVSYESMIESTPAVLRAVLDWFGIAASDEEVLSAVDTMAFSNLSRVEPHLRNTDQGRFFRRGSPGGGQEELKPETLEMIRGQAEPLWREAKFREETGAKA